MSGSRLQIAAGLLAALSFLSLDRGAREITLQQDGCRAPMPPASKEPNIFSAVQERDLGDAVAEQLEPMTAVIDDSGLSAHLRRIGAGLAAHLPAGYLEPRFFLTDDAGPEAFAFPGGRIYVSRKMVGITRSEDELAAVLAHELGHLAARHHTIAVTRSLREVLNVTELGDREDVRARYHQLMDNEARKPRLIQERESHETRNQIEADRVGVFLLAAAGYDVQAWVAVLDRIMGTQGDTGNVFSRMFGTTSPDARRLRETIAASAAVPGSCLRPADAARAETYATWQTAVARYTTAPGSGSVPGLVGKVQLPALPAEVSRLRFSPDGRHVLAEDESGLSVLTRDPFAVAFRIDGRTDSNAHFTPDSQHLVLHSPDLRVEWWSLSTRALTRSRDLAVADGCLRTALSPNGTVLACASANSNLTLIDADTGLTLFQQTRFFEDNRNNLYGRLITFGRDGIAPMQFSPDGRFFVTGFPAPDGGPRILVLEMTAPKPRVLKLPWAAGRYLINTFAFVGPDRIMGLNAHDNKKSGYVSLPSGEVTGEFVLPVSRLRSVTRGGVVLISPFQKYNVGVLDLATLTSVRALTVEAYDQYDDVFVAERGTGDLALYSTRGNTVMATAALSGRPLRFVHAAVVSSDFGWLAASTGRRSAVWDLRTGQRLGMMRGFSSAYFDTTGKLLADLPALGAEPRRLVELDLVFQRMTPRAELTPGIFQDGRWLVTARQLPPNVIIPKGVEYEYRDALGAAPGWKKTFPQERPILFGNAETDAVVLRWDADTPEGRMRIAAHKQIVNTVRMGDIAGDYVIEAYEAATGTLRGAMLLETGKGSFRAVNHAVAGNLMVTSDNLGRVLVHEVDTGRLRGHAFGTAPVVHQESGTMVVRQGLAGLAIYDLDTITRRSSLKFDAPVLLRAFSADGSRLLVLTSDQTVYTVTVPR